MRIVGTHPTWGPGAFLTHFDSWSSSFCPIEGVLWASLCRGVRHGQWGSNSQHPRTDALAGGFSDALQGKEAAVGSPVCVLTQEAESGPETGTVGLGRVE